MKKIFLVIVLIAAAIVGANAQKGTKQISAGVELGFPTGDFSYGAKTGFGVNGKAILALPIMVILPLQPASPILDLKVTTVPM